MFDAKWLNDQKIVEKNTLALHKIYLDIQLDIHNLNPKIENRF